VPCFITSACAGTDGSRRHLIFAAQALRTGHGTRTRILLLPRMPTAYSDLPLIRISWRYFALVILTRQALVLPMSTAWLLCAYPVACLALPSPSLVGDSASCSHLAASASLRAAPALADYLFGVGRDEIQAERWRSHSRIRFSFWLRRNAFGACYISLASGGREPRRVCIPPCLDNVFHALAPAQLRRTQAAAAFGDALRRLATCDTPPVRLRLHG